MTTPPPGYGYGYPQQPNQPPAYGYPPQQPYGQPGWGQQPPTPQKPSTGKKVGIGCAGAAGLLVLLGACGALIGDAEPTASTSTTATTTPADQSAKAPAPVTPTTEAPKTEAPKPKTEVKPDVSLTASKTTFKPTVLTTDGDFTAVKVTVVNNSAKEVSISTLLFEVTDTDGAKHNAELFGAEDQIDPVTLRPGEKASGTITVKGDVTPAKVYFKNGLLGTTYSAPVS
ncbi:DUF4352 domain-containing protein [Streptomyces sp. ISL-43]|uniref:DUF4352 domain-containing protein n=1 Tax=Streptomyces sp. ISL-43 TaxID=2819183 RepID=UPI001BE6CE32|nr:DUF4352 domain-containing protein [Streptomyces sp. ISL-43]MBT2452027.1 DUF4352 domain-containing protein [Streptomyces sp. ISL-43]